MRSPILRVFRLVLVVLAVLSLSAPVLAKQGKKGPPAGKGKSMAKAKKMDKAASKVRGKAAAPGQLKKAEGAEPGEAKGKAAAPGQIKKATGEHPGGKAKGKEAAPGQIKKATGEHPGGKAKGRKDAVRKAMAKQDRTSKEQTKHLKRLAKIDRLQAIATEKNNEKLAQKAKMLREKEQTRHTKSLAKINASKGKKAAAENKQAATAEN